MLSWLHISDFHFKGGDPYDRDVVLRALVRSVAEFREKGRRPDLIFATGDVAHSGKAAEYAAATDFFDALLAATRLDKRRLFVIPGNHDVDRGLGIGLARTLHSREEADTYFGPNVPKMHLLQKQGEYVRWYNAYFAGIRRHPDGSTCGPVEPVEIDGVSIGVLPVNSALFCQGDDDHAKLWIGRRCLEAGLEQLKPLGAMLNVALVHHPLDWLHDTEVANVRTSLQSGADVILRGHLHRTDVEAVVGVMGEALHMAAGAAYHTRQWPNRALYGTLEDGRISVFPIRYEDEPREIWTVDPSAFPSERDYTKAFAVPRLTKGPAAPAAAAAALPAEPPRATRFRSNIPSRRNLPFVGRDDLLRAIGEALADRSREAVIVLYGQPGVGKSELAREFARRNGDGYPGGRFILDAGKQALAVDLARIGNSLLDLDLPTEWPLQDQGLAALAALGSETTLLIFDNVVAEDSVAPWLPPAGMPCHVLMTTNLDRWDASWTAFPIPPLLRPDSLELVERIAGAEVRGRFGDRLAELADGLPVQLVPASATLAYEARRGRLDAASLSLSEEAQTSFLGVYEQLERPAKLLLHAAARLNAQRIPMEELRHQMAEGAGWSDGEFQRRLDTCLDLHLLQGRAELRMHQLFFSFLHGRELDGDFAKDLRAVVAVQARRLIAIAEEIAANPNRPELASLLLAFRSDLASWQDQLDAIPVAEGESLGRALCEIGRFEAARPWFERAVKEKEQGDVHGRVDHASLGGSVHQVGDCLSQLGQYEAARPWYERAVKEAEQGDVHGRVDRKSLAASQRAVAKAFPPR